MLHLQHNPLRMNNVTGVNGNRQSQLISSSPSTTIIRGNSDNPTRQRAVSVRLVSQWGHDFLSTCTINSIRWVNKITPKTNQRDGPQCLPIVRPCVHAVLQHTKPSGEEQQACLSWEWVSLEATNPTPVILLITTNGISIIIFVDFKK